MNRSYIENELRWYFQDYPDMGWKRDSDALDGDLALSTGGTTSKTLTAQGVATVNHKGAKVPDVSNRKIIKEMAEIKRQAPEMYEKAKFEFSGSLEEVEGMIEEAKSSNAALVSLLGRVL
jgi:hypothetical protein